VSAADPVYLPTDLQAALDHARHLATCGVPIFLAEPALRADGTWDSEGGKGKTGYWLPTRWQDTEADPAVVDCWRVGMAMCAVMGHLVDAVDVDPRNGGEDSRELLPMPTSYGRQRTPSGGTHDLIANLGVRSRDGLLPGVDLKAGVPGVGGHGFVFLAPTIKMDKSAGEPGMYTWLQPPQLDALVLVGGDTTGEPLADLLASRSAVEYVGPDYTGPEFASLTPAQQAWAERDLEATLDAWRQQLTEAADWPEGFRDDRGRGWEALSRDAAWVLACAAAAPWSPLDADTAGQAYHDLLPEQLADNEACAGKWTAALRRKAAREAVRPPPWQGLDPEAGESQDVREVDATNPAEAANWLRHELGSPGTLLAGLFRRGEDLVHTPQIGCDGYIPLSEDSHDEDGPAQVQIANLARVQARVQFGYRVVRWLAKRPMPVPCLFPAAAVSVALGDLHLAPNLRVLRGVTHTPMMRRNGTVLDTEGYDDASQRLFLPDAALMVKPVPVEPDIYEVERARDLLLSMLVDFPWNTVHDRANYLALLLTPLLREIITPPYKMGLINAHEAGSGKSLLAWILRTVHGGVLRGDVPKDGEEFRKQITAVLATTTAPIVQFDNVHTLDASQLDALLTTNVWSDRQLGRSVDLVARNDRLWVATGNNVGLGGDMVRRVLWVSIDPQQPNPEERTDFVIPQLKEWVTEHRGELLGALLILIRSWMLAGRPIGDMVGADDYARWIEACRGILAHAGFEGIVGHPDTVRQKQRQGTDETQDFLNLLWEHFGEDVWTAGQAAALMSLDEAPADMKAGSSRSLGRWLVKHEGQWAGGISVRQAGSLSGSTRWHLRKVH
jgi:hypothetical protein